MKKALLLALLVSGCATAPPPVPVAVPLKTQTQTTVAQVAVSTRTFKLNGNYQIDASTNLVSWWPVAVVYSVVSVELSSSVSSKYPRIFYRITLQK